MSTQWKVVRVPARLEESLRALADWHLQTDQRTEAIRSKFGEFAPRTDQEHLAVWVAIYEGAKLLAKSRHIEFSAFERKAHCNETNTDAT